MEENGSLWFQPLPACKDHIQALPFHTRNWTIVEIGLQFLGEAKRNSDICRNRFLISFGSASMPTIAASIASWFSILDARAASVTTISLRKEPYCLVIDWENNKIPQYASGVITKLERVVSTCKWHV
jgi:hypothetical protein